MVPTRILLCLFPVYQSVLATKIKITRKLLEDTINDPTYSTGTKGHGALTFVWVGTCYTELVSELEGSEGLLVVMRNKYYFIAQFWKATMIPQPQWDPGSFYLSKLPMLRPILGVENCILS